MLKRVSVFVCKRLLETKSFCDLRISHSAVDSDAVNQVTDFISPEQPKRTLKVAIIGAPNAGKSTLINKIVGHPVLCVSKKVHTTRHRERAAVVRDNTQILFVDTPGLVSIAKIRKHNLEESFKEDGLRALREAHVVGVIHDAANRWTGGHLDSSVLRIFEKLDGKKAFLVVNKVDIIKSKKDLLQLIDQLTATQTTPALSTPVQQPPEEEPANQIDPVPAKIKYPSRGKGWPNFSEVFIVSALNGNGVSDLLDYLLKEADEGAWSLAPGKITDRTWPVVLQELVRGRLLDELPEEVPYKLIIETEYFHINDLGEVIAVVLVTCPLLRYRKILIAGGGRRVRTVAKLAETDARAALKTNVRLRVVVTSNEKSKPSPRY